MTLFYLYSNILYSKVTIFSTKAAEKKSPQERGRIKISNTSTIRNERLLDIPTHKNEKLTWREVRFIDEYMITGNATDAYRKAFPDNDPEKVSGRANSLLRRQKVRDEIEKRSKELSKSAILSANDILEMYSAIARGEVKDQFGLDAALKDRLTALKELAHIQIDIASKLQEQDNKLEVRLVRD